MSNGIQKYMKVNQAKVNAAKLIGEALEEAAKLLKAAGLDTSDTQDVITEILEADDEG